MLVATTMILTPPNESPRVSRPVSLPDVTFHHGKGICVRKRMQPLLLIPQVQPEVSLNKEVIEQGDGLFHQQM